MELKNKPNIFKRPFVILGIILIILCIWALQAILIIMYFGKPDHAGVFGDMFGFINSFVSGIAFCIIAYTLKLHHEETRILRDQLRLHHGETRILHVQSFEERFFKLIDLFNSKVNSTEIDTKIRKLRDNQLLGKETRI